MPVILGVAGSVGNSNGLIPGTISSVEPTTCTVDGASTPIQVLTGHPYGPRVGDRVGLQQIGRQYVAFPIDGFDGVDNEWHYCGHYNEPAFQNNLGNYSDNVALESWEFGNVSFRKDSSGIVHGEGLGYCTANIGVGVPMFTLPPGYRPNFKIPILCGNANGQATLEIRPNGDVVTLVTLASGSYQCFDSISFVAEDSGTIPWVDLTSGLQSGFTPYPSANGYAPPRGFISNAGDLHLSGAIAGPGNTTTSNVLQLPAGMYNTDYPDLHIVASSPANGGGYARLDHNITGMMTWQTPVAGTTNAFFFLDGIIIPQVGVPKAWHKMLTYANSWTTFAGWPPAMWTINKNGRAYTRGLIQNGTLNASIGFVLPQWWGPRKHQLMLGGAAGNGSARIDVQQNVTSSGLNLYVQSYYNSGTNGFVSLSDLRWQAAGQSA